MFDFSVFFFHQESREMTVEFVQLDNQDLKEKQEVLVYLVCINNEDFHANQSKGFPIYMYIVLGTGTLNWGLVMAYVEYFLFFSSVDVSIISKCFL